MSEQSGKLPDGGTKTGVGAARAHAVAASRAELPPGLAWVLTAIVILAGGVTLYTARASIGAGLDRWLPRQEQPAEATSAEEPEQPAPPPAVESVTEPQWTYVDIEAALRPLPARTEALIAEGRDELSQFSGLDSADETRALVIRNRWRLWGRVWHNRVEHLRGPMPPAEACDIHAALEPTCRAIRDSLELLDQVPAADSVTEARELFDGATAIFEALYESQAEPEEAPE